MGEKQTMTIVDHTGRQILEEGDKFIQITDSKVKIEHQVQKMMEINGEKIVQTETEHAGTQRYNRENLQEHINKGSDETTDEGFKYRLTQ